MSGGIGRAGGGATSEVGTVGIGVESGGNDRTIRFQQNEIKSSEGEPKQLVLNQSKSW